MIRRKVGYQIRFESTATSHSKIVFLTEGLLLRQAAPSLISHPTTLSILSTILTQGLLLRRSSYSFIHMSCWYALV